MSPNDVFIRSLTDEELLLLSDISYFDLLNSSTVQQSPDIDEDWMGSCFAALYVCCEEMNRRGLKRNTECV